MLQSSVSEIDVIKLIDETLSKVDNQAMRDRILRWAWDKYASSQSPTQPIHPIEETLKRSPQTKKKPKSGAKSKPSFSLVKDLDLNPDGKKSFRSFAKEKTPKSGFEKCVVAIYYLHNELGLDCITSDYVFTCFKDAGWRVPSDMYNVLAVTSSRKGWLDTSDMMNINVTPRGENLIEHDLPYTKKE
jgi:hypothetical protein